METLQKVAFNLVEAVFGSEGVLSRLIYSLVGIAGLINTGLLFMHTEE